ncbi:MAG: hypothetical protein FD147_1213 [Chloroflexi bacterium]|nr:MAG: hypothetical protein FD147_1213 [Chloroflexota bacterium]MBA4376952.1 hypothetical protein [Anaerolinea sp.]
MLRPYVLKDVFIQFFDINSTPTVLNEQKIQVSKTRYKFLTSKNRYEKFQSSEEKILTDHFLIQRYIDNRLRESEVWKRYMQTVADTQPEYWKRQVPFYVRLRKHELSLSGQLKEDDKKIKVDSYLMLNSLGWSVRMEIRLKKDFTPAELRDQIDIFRDPARNPFELNGESYSLKEIFKLYKDTLLKDGFLPADHGTRPSFWNLAFVNTPGVSGVLTPVDKMRLLDLGSLVKVLFPKHGAITFRPEEGVNKPQIPNLTTTVFGEDLTNFSITNFNAGTFTFMQDTIYQPNLEAQVMCYAKNVCDCTWLCEQWINYKKLAVTATSTPQVNNLVKDGFAALKGLENHLRNETCQAFFASHKKF